MRKVFALLGALFLLILAVPLALAQDLTGSPEVVRDIWEIVKPLIVLLVGTVGPVLVAWIGAKLVGLMNIQNENQRKELEAKIRDALHASAANALKYAMTRAGLVPRAGVAIPPAVLDVAVEYVRTKNPDTASQAGVDDNDLEQIILSKVPDVIGALAGAVVPAAVDQLSARR